jgi:hypothetical protein
VICVPLDIPEICAPNQAFAIPAATIKLTHYPWPRRKIWRVTLQTRPRSVDRTRSPIGVSKKREYFKYQPETIDDFALRLSKLGVQRRSNNLQKAAIGGHLSDL